MANYINRPRYLQQLIDRRDNGEVKIIIGSMIWGRFFYCDICGISGV